MKVDVIKVSGKGQISLPTEIRRSLSIADGDCLAVCATDKVIVLRPLHLPTKKQFSRWLDEAQVWAREAGYAEEDMAGIVKSVRRRKKQ